MKMGKWVYGFAPKGAAGNAEMKALLGGKGANLAEMCNLGLPVPPGFTITTEVCTGYLQDGRTYPADLKGEVAKALAAIEADVGARFGDSDNPLLVSVRSGARASMPGMMDTVLNLGLNDATVAGLARQSDDARFAYDSYRRFIQMYGNVVLDIDHHHFEEILSIRKEDLGVTLDTDLPAEELADLVVAFKEKVESERGEPFPDDPEEQIWGAIGAVFDSWTNQRAKTYRMLHDIPDDWGTAVNVQAMVFGNMGDDCATGVSFTRDPSTGENAIYGEFLVNAQGEDVVAGLRTPQNLTVAGRQAGNSKLPSMEEVMPEVFAELLAVRDRLEGHYRDMQDIEFTVQGGRLYLLQTRSGKRTAQAALRIAAEMCATGLISREDAVRRIDPDSLNQLLHPRLDPEAERNVLTTGLAASPGAATGAVVFTADEAESRAAIGEDVILVRAETSPEDIHGMHAARGILTSRGGMTSHAAVVARGMGRPCVCGAQLIRIDEAAGTMTVGDATVAAGAPITIDGSNGEVMVGSVPTIQPALSDEFMTIMQWADQIRRMSVRTNAETPADARAAVRYGAEGIGLCRTEHMFFDAERIVAMRRMILAEDEDDRRAVLDTLLPMQRADFVELFGIMKGLPVTIRLLDPPLHEFLPHSRADMTDLAEAAGLDLETVRLRVARLREANPMLGHRGCRLGITYPEIYEMQVRAVFEAAVAVRQDSGETVLPEVMIPLVATAKEFDILKADVDRIAEQTFARAGTSVDYLVGTMIELPRAALRAGDIARTAEFFSFGTNDLTQTTFGISRDDAANFIETYRRRGIIEHDPFVTVDETGVGELVEIAVERGKASRPDIKLGICGEHGGDPASIRFCDSVGLDYVSCSPYRVPIARLAAAQAALDRQDRSEAA